MASSNTAKPETPALTAAMMAASPAATQAWMEILNDNARFLTDRLQQDMETQKALLACKSPTELLQVQAEFFRSAMAQYSDYATRIFTKMSATADETVKATRKGQARSYDDVPI